MDLELTKGWFAIVSERGYKKAAPYSWFAQTSPEGYVYAASHLGRRGPAVLLHRFLTDASEDQIVDHRNRDTLNCFEDNLRICTRSQNCANQKVRSTNTSGFKGVNWKKPGRKNPVGRWVSRICVQYKRIQLGYFDSAAEAARAYDVAAMKHFGEFAKTNFPQ